MNWKKLLIVLLLLLAILGFYLTGAGDYLNLEYLQTNLGKFRTWTANYGLLAYGAYFFLYVFSVALFLPVAAALTLLAGALFPLTKAVVLVSFASTLGATANAFLARYLLRTWLEQRYQRQLRIIHRNLERNGVGYLFSLRLLPIFPFFVINLVFGLTRMKLWTFYWISQLGTLAGTFVYINAGNSLASIGRFSDILSPRILLSFLLLALLPYLSKLLLAAWRYGISIHCFPRPRNTEVNLVVIGAGAGGLVASYIASMLKAKVVLIERNKMGGDCLNRGCVPSKSLLAAAKLAHASVEASKMGVYYDKPRINFAAVMGYVKDKIKAIEPHDSVARYRSLGVEVIQGEARLLSPYAVQVGERTITTRRIILATGGSPRMPEISGLQAVRPLTSDTIWDLEEQPRRLLVLGGGPIGCELALAFARLGTEVVLVERGAQILSREEPQAAAIAAKTLQASGVKLLLGWQAQCFERNADREIVSELSDTSGNRCCVLADRILVAMGRVPTADTPGLAELGVRFSERNSVEVNEFLETNVPGLFAIGDTSLSMQFTHVASFSAYFATVNALLGQFKKSPISLNAVPRVTYLQPEIARVGLTESEARRDYGEDVESCTYELAENDRAIAENQTDGFIHLVLQKSRQKVLGVTIVAPHAGEMLGEWVMVLNRKVKQSAIFASIYAYPTYSEASKGVIAEFKKRHMPVKILSLLEVFFRWQR